MGLAISLNPSITPLEGTVQVKAVVNPAKHALRVEFYIDGTLKLNNETESIGGGSATYVYNWNTTTATEGSHTILVKSFRSGNRLWETASLVVDVQNDQEPQPTPPPVNQSLPQITGTIAIGSTAFSSEGAWSNSPDQYRYQWKRCGTGGTGCGDIAGATNSQYVIPAGDAGYTLRCQVIASNQDGESLPAISVATSIISGGTPPPSAPTNTGLPTISDTTPTAGQVLTAGNGTWTGSPTSYDYQWQSCHLSGASVLIDTFDRADGAIGAGWADLLGDGGLRVVGNQVATASGTSKAAYRSGGTVGPDCEVYATWATVVLDEASVKEKLYLRMKDVPGATRDGYALRMQRFTTQSDEFAIEKITNGVVAVLGAVVSRNILDGDSFLFRAEGSLLQGYHKSGSGPWVLAIERTDATYALAGYIGLGLGDPGDRADNFGGGTLAATSGCSPIPGATASTYTVNDNNVGSTLRLSVIASNVAGPSEPAVSAETSSVLSSAPPPPPPPPPPSWPGPFYIDFNPADGTLPPWYRMQRGNNGVDQNFYVLPSYPNGISNPGFIGIVQDPLGEKGLVHKLTVEATNTYAQGGSGPDRVDAWMHNGSQTGWNAQGNEIWERVQVMFPASGVWKPTLGTWNWWLQHHNILSGVPGTGIVFGVDGRTSLSPSPQLFCRVTGGDTQNPTPVTEWRWTAGVQTNHWYDMLVRIVWKTDNTGIFEWWMDGVKIYSVTRSTLAYNSSSGVRDQPNFQFSNYRSHVTWPSTIYFGRTAIGATRASIGG